MLGGGSGSRGRVFCFGEESQSAKGRTCVSFVFLVASLLSHFCFDIYDHTHSD